MPTSQDVKDEFRKPLPLEELEEKDEEIKVNYSNSFKGDGLSLVCEIRSFFCCVVCRFILSVVASNRQVCYRSRSS